MACGEMTIVLLGTGTSTGVPMLGCDCDVCRSPDPRDRRTRCSALVAWADQHILIDTATDLRQQALRENINHVEAVLYTHAHADHVHGIDELRAFNMVAGGAIPIFGSPATIALIRRNFSYIFSSRQGAGFRPRLQPWTIDGPFCLCGLPIEPIPLRHGEGEAMGYRIGSFAYLTDCSAVAKDVRRRLEDLDVLVLDGLRFRPHPTHFNIDQAVELAREVGARRTLLTHLCHEVRHASDSLKLPPGVELAYDGQRFCLPVKRAAVDHAPLRAALPGSPAPRMGTS